MSRWLGSWPGIFAVWGACGLWLAAAVPFMGWSTALTALTSVLSVVALTFTQLVLREQAPSAERTEKMVRTIAHDLPDVDDSCLQD